MVYINENRMDYVLTVHPIYMLDLGNLYVVKARKSNLCGGLCTTQPLALFLGSCFVLALALGCTARRDTAQNLRRVARREIDE